MPQFLIATKLVPALLAGCCVVLKPAPESPLDALLLAEMLEEIGLPPGRRQRAARRRGTRRPSRHPPWRGQGVVHGLDGSGTARCASVRRGPQAGQPRTRRQVRGDHPRRRRSRHRRDRNPIGEPVQQRPDLQRPDPNPGSRQPIRRIRRRARRRDGRRSSSATPPTPPPRWDRWSRSANSSGSATTSTPARSRAPDWSSAAPTCPTASSVAGTSGPRCSATPTTP